MATSYELTVRNESEENPHIIIFDPNARPGTPDPSSAWRSFDLTPGQHQQFKFPSDRMQIVGAPSRPDGARRARSRALAPPSTIDLAGVEAADLVVRGDASKGFTFHLENVKRS